MPNNSLSVANAFLERAESEGRTLTNMKLQKLLYFAQGHSLALRGDPLIDELPEAWPYGPVYTHVYHEFKRFGSSPIRARSLCPFPDDNGNHDWPPIRNPQDQQLIDAVWVAYRDINALKLSDMSHVAEGPWFEARSNGGSSVISRESMKRYFESLGQ